MPFLMESALGKDLPNVLGGEGLLINLIHISVSFMPHTEEMSMILSIIYIIFQHKLKLKYRNIGGLTHFIEKWREQCKNTSN